MTTMNTPCYTRKTWIPNVVIVDAHVSLQAAPFRGEGTQGTPVWRPPDW